MGEVGKAVGEQTCHSLPDPLKSFKQGSNVRGLRLEWVLGDQSRGH